MTEKSAILDAFEIATVLLGLFSASVSGALAAYFLRRGTRLAFSFGLMLAAECVVSAAVLIFAVGAMLDSLHVFPDEYQTGARIFMFSVTAITSLHLAYQVKSVEDDH